jgi:hypothetical protein
MIPAVIAAIAADQALSNLVLGLIFVAAAVALALFTAEEAGCVAVPIGIAIAIVMVRSYLEAGG